MTYDWEKLNQIFHQALEYDASERAGFIERACGDDAELRAEALALLSSHEEDLDFMETPLMTNLAGQFGDWQGKIVGAMRASAQPAGNTRPPDYLVGQVLDGKYRIEERRGQGGMGAVYRATHEGTGRRVAIKIIAPEFMANAEFVERFKREAKAAGMLNHPHVVNVTDFGLAARTGGQSVAYLVMEYLEGLTLAELLKEKRGLALEQVVSILEQVCRAIDEAHRAGILHRDLKPENIWLEPLKHGGYHVKVLDFGLAKLRDVTPDEAKDAAPQPPPPSSAIPNKTRLLSDAEAQTLRRVFSAPPQLANQASADERDTLKFTDDEAERAFDEAEQALTRPTLGQLDTRTAPHWFSRVGMVLGTPTYMSPEQCRGERLDASSDIYSLGVIAYQMLAGEAPFAGTTADLLAKHKEIPPPSLLLKRPALPVGVADVLQGALSKERSGRPATAGAFACALRLGAEGERAIRREASTLYQKHRRLFLTLAARVHAPVVLLGLLLLFGALRLPVMSPLVSVLVFGLLWLMVLFLTLYGNAATSAACALVVEDLPKATQSSAASKAIAAAVWRESGMIAGAVLSAAGDAVRGSLSLRRRGWRAYLDSLLLVPLVLTEKLRGRVALDRAKQLSARVRRLAVDVRALHIAAVLFTLLAYQIALLVMGGLLDGFAGTPPAQAPEMLFLLVLMFVLLLVFILMQVRTGIEHAVLYARARELNGERANVLTEASASTASVKLERARFPHARAIALASVLVVSIMGWQGFKTELMVTSIQSGAINVVKTTHASGMAVPLWSNGMRPAIGFLIHHPLIIKFLLEKGADVNARVVLDRSWIPPYRSNVVTTPLMTALSVDAANSVPVLLESGADVHAQDSTARTPLMVAGIYSPASIDLLLAYGAGINERTSKGTALLSAARYRGISDDSLITEEDLNAQSNVVAHLLSKGADINARDEEGRTALMVLSMEYRPDRIILPIAETLLRAGAGINARDRTGRTPLMYAVRHKQRATVGYLLAQGADTTAKDNNGTTALDLANQMHFDDIARMLSATPAGNTPRPLPPQPPQ